jgi:hypothetical protein
MKITGYQLREAITMWKLRKTTAEGQFTDSLAKFADETKDTPQAIVSTVLHAEECIVRLQIAQMQYNLAVKVTPVDFGEITLAQAIKLSGVVSRIEKIWAGATSETRSPYGYNARVRDPQQVRAESTVTPKDVLQETSRLTKRAGALRAAIGAGNTREVEIEDLDASLFE